MSVNNNEEVMAENHTLTMQSRKILTLTGVNDVVCFDEKSVLLYTVMGKLTVKGNGLKISRLQVGQGDGDLTVEGQINSLEYNGCSNTAGRNESTIKKLFR